MPDKLALVTGASKGIGRSTAKLLAEQGFTILATARKKRDLLQLQTEIRKNGGNCEYLCADLHTSTEIKRISALIKSLKKPLSILVHSAGIAKVGTIASFSETAWQETLAVNLTAPFLLSKACIPLLENNAHIFFINSIAGKTVFAEWGAYAVSKWGLKALADTLRLELTGSGIKITSVFPSSVDTTLHDNLPYNWDRRQMLRDADVARAIISCFQQSEKVQITEIDLANLAGAF